MSASTPQGTKPPETPCAFETPSEQQVRRRFLFWTITLALAYLASALAVRHQSELPAALAWGVLLATAAILLQTMRAFRATLRAGDELARRIQLESLAFAFAAGLGFALIAPFAARLLDTRLGDNWTPFVLLTVWSFASWLNMRRYRGGDIA